MVREIHEIVDSVTQREGGGFVVRRPFPVVGLSHLDPFLLIDEMGPVVYGPGEAVGAPEHPHRGFETVTYLLDGTFEHRDSAGHHGVLGPGSVQWMTAGAGVLHAEMPSEQVRREGGRVHGFQIWVNLPRSHKWIAPRYQDVPADAIPEATTEDGLAHVRVIAGEALGVSAVVDTHQPITYQDWTVQPGGVGTVEVGADDQALVYVFEGALHVGSGPGVAVADGQLAVLEPGTTVRLSVPEGAGHHGRALVLAGPPIGEPVARYGPFVMNHPGELKEAMLDFQTGRLTDPAKVREA